MDKEPGLDRFDASGGVATAEMVTQGHPDKFCDQVADAVRDEALRQEVRARIWDRPKATRDGARDCHANTRDVANWVANSFKDLRPQAIIEYLGLQKPSGWTCCSTAAFGHYGRADFRGSSRRLEENAAHG